MPVCIKESTQHILLCSEANSEGLPNMYRQHALTKVSVSSRFPENGRGGEIFGSLNLKGDGLVGGGDGE